MAIHSSKFIAIGVRQGDAFYLEHNGKKILVDGGKARNTFPNHFQKVTGQTDIDILACTHADADHSLGVLGFLESDYLTTKELWVPGNWTYRLMDLLASPTEFISEIAVDIFKHELEENPLSLQEIGDDLAKAREEDFHASFSDEMQLDDLIEMSDDIQSDVFVGHLPYAPFTFYLTDPKQISLFIEACVTARIIRDIITTAYRKNITIRFFEYQKSSCPNFGSSFYPVNAIEATRIVSKSINALQYLALSASNKQSIVFAYVANGVPNVLFSADSDLDFESVIPWCNGMIVTTPHHGSEANKYAYKRFDKEFIANGLNKAVWVRSDGKFKKRPCSSYLHLAGNRYCTLCRHADSTHQEVIFNLIKNQWKADLNVRSCVCV